jgi:hypothetical protein
MWCFAGGFEESIAHGEYVKIRSWILQQQLTRICNIGGGTISFLEEELQEDHAIDEAVSLAQLPPEEVHALQGAPPEVRPSRVKDYIIAFLIVVIVRILFF